MATKTEIERLTVVETKLDNMQDDIAEVKDTVHNLADKLDAKFAAKWVERVVAGFVGLILTAFAGLLIYAAFHQQPTSTQSTTRTTTVTVNGDGTTTKTVSDENGHSSTTTSPSASGAKPSTTVIKEEIPVTPQQEQPSDNSNQVPNARNNKNTGLIPSLLETIGL